VESGSRKRGASAAKPTPRSLFGPLTTSTRSDPYFLPDQPCVHAGPLSRIERFNSTDHTVNILVVNGPNLNMLGQREPEIYGSTTLADIERQLQERFPEVGFSFFQSNQEGEMIDALQQADVDGIVLNGAAFTHTSVALRDAISSISTPVVEVHISNIHAREAFRHQSLTAGVCVGSISGLGVEGYSLAVRYFLASA